MKYIRYIFFAFACLFFGYVICGHIILPADQIDHRSVCYDYEEKLYAYSSDGSKQLVEKLGRFDGVSAIETVLPSDIDSQVTSFCFRGNDAKAYIDDQLVYEYSVKGNKWFGTISPECYFMIPISEKDAGHTLRIELGYSEGILYQNYIGTEFGIWMHILEKYIGELVIAAITMVMGALTILISAIYGEIRNKKIDIRYLGFGVFLASVWLLVNSVYRQIIFSNVSVADDFPFLMVMLIPFPFMIYMDIIQEKRFTKLYLVASCILSIVDFTCCALYVAGTKELMDTFIFVALACFVAIGSVIVTFVLDLRSGKISAYRYVAFGLFGAFTFAIIQLVTYFNRTGIFSGVYLAVGLICLLVGAAIHTVYNLFSIEKEKTAAELASEAKGRFLANMSHEIRTPINAVLGMDEMILRESEEPAIRDYALDIQNAGKNLLALINDILDISKIESGKMEIIPIEYDVSSMINDTMNMIYHKAKAKDLKAEIKVSESLPSRLIGDDIRIRQVLINILNNAVKYTNNGSVTLDITSEEIGDNKTLLHFKVIDTGVGIKKDDLPKLYAQFERIEERKNRDIEGTGLGMSITLQLLELMNSKLNVESVYGKGSCFYFDLEQEIVDRTPIGNLSERIRAQEEEYSYETSFSASTSHILVVDDNAVNRKVVRSLLKDIGIKIDEVDSGEKCLEKVCERKYDIIFLDHMMPGLDGIQTLARFAGLDNNKNLNTPVIALTANAVTGAKEMYLNAGFHDFLAKPVIYSKLEAMLLKYLPEEKILPVSETHQEKLLAAKEEAAAKQKIIEDLAEINIEYALLVNGNMNILFDTLVAFANMMDADARELDKYKSFLPDDDAIKQYRVKVHSMKASATLVGMMNLGGMARMLELAAINQKVDAIDKVHDLFIEEWFRNKKVLKDALGKYIEESTEDDREKIEINKDLLFEQLNMLKEAVCDVDVDRADELVDIIKGFDYPSNVQETMDDLYAAVISLNEEAVADLIVKLIEQLY